MVLEILKVVLLPAVVLVVGWLIAKRINQPRKPVVYKALGN